MGKFSIFYIKQKHNKTTIKIAFTAQNSKNEKNWMLSGNEAALLAVEKAVMIGGKNLLMYTNGFFRTMAAKMIGYTTMIITRFALYFTSLISLIPLK